MEDKIKQAKADVVVSMYEARASLLPPKRLGDSRMEDIHNLVQYNFINSMIAKILDNHNISHAYMEDAMDRYRGKEVINGLMNN